MSTILVIEDQSSIRANLIELLTEEGFDVFGFENGFTGMMWALKHFPDLIVCDIMLPDMDGYSILRQLRDYPSMANVPFIFLTAKADKSSIFEGMYLGADEYITKPFKRIELLQAIEFRLKQRLLK